MIGDLFPVFEADVAGGVELWDATHVVNQEPGVWPARSEPIERIYLHHSGALGPLGFDGFRVSAEYSESKKRWPSTAYHYWIPFGEPDAPCIRLYRGNPDSARSYHTGGQRGGPSANGHGLSVCLQGDLRRVKPSSFQVEALEALIPWLQERHAATLSQDRWLSWHSESAEWGGSGKPSCPGPHVEAWARAWRELA